VIGRTDADAGVTYRRSGSPERTKENTHMRRLIDFLFHSEARSSYPCHFHPDDHGNPVFCDESACHPANDPTLYTPRLPFADSYLR
jgi:hypothetical protein